jgi:hypothetical protein
MSTTNIENIPDTDTPAPAPEAPKPAETSETKPVVAFKPGSALSNKQRGPRKLPDLPVKEPELIKVGDTFVAFFNPFHQKLIVAQESGLLDTKYGHYRYSDIVGKPYGTMVSFLTFAQQNLTLGR